MSSRRLPTTQQNGRGRAPSSAGQHAIVPTISRPPTAIGRRAESVDIRDPPARKKESNEENEYNIRVAVRCRRRSEKEIEENSNSIVITEGPKSQSITIETAATTSVMGVVTLPPTRTYPFDVVFGPEADQATIYQEVVSPMLEEVIQGYNCTLFAYGQTGTGKTYTMQGDLQTSPLGNPLAGAGMIPRALTKLFQRLEGAGSDYSVRVSYVELYNEELRDLLAPELSAPTSSTTQPMGAGAAQPPPGSGSLKLFDDNAKRGVLIQGLEEETVRNASEAIALLRKGSERRQIAATKFNDHSSRSHSVFSITVHSKESSSLGDDTLKMGKFNLVDLAGSENIGRSGAENKRAREAGMINQSLLTLGRVINALVDKSSHIPYRESKLTRLLQDSLGGRTKTYIIATVSPARSNLEETLSTLEYALRAKSIRNKPEVNQRISRNALIKEYVEEIGRLKADLVSSREKNGIYFSQETWDQLSAEHDDRRTAFEEAKRNEEEIKSQMLVLREELEQGLAMLSAREAELREAHNDIEIRNLQLDQQRQEIQKTKCALEEESMIRQAHERNEKALEQVARRLKQVAQEATQDVIPGLHGKIGRTSQSLHKNSTVVLDQTQNMSQIVSKMKVVLSDFGAHQSKSFDSMSQGFQNIQQMQGQALTNLSSVLETRLKSLKDTAGRVFAIDEEDSSRMTAYRSVIEAFSDTLRADLSDWNKSMLQSCATVLSEVTHTQGTILAEVTDALDAYTGVFQTVLENARNVSSLNMEQQRGNEVLHNAFGNEEINRLRNQNKKLEQALVAEKAKSTEAQRTFLQDVAGLLRTYTQQQHEGLDRVASEAIAGNRASEQQIQRFGVSLKAARQLTVEREESFGRELESAQADSESIHTDGIKRLDELKRNAQQMESINDVMKKSLDELNQTQEGRLRAFKRQSDTTIHQLHSSKKARLEAVEEIVDNAVTGSKSIGIALDNHSQDVYGKLKSLNKTVQTLAGSSASFQTSEQKDMVAMETALKVIQEKGVQPVVTTNTTPKKRIWDCEEPLPVLGDRNAILEEWRRNVGSSSHSSSSQGSAGQAPIVKSEPQEELPPSPKPVKLSPPPLPLPPVKDIKNLNGPLIERPLNLVDTRNRRRKIVP